MEYIVPVFYVMTAVVLGPTYSARGHLSNPAIRLSYIIITYLTLIALLALLVWRAVTCHYTYNRRSPIDNMRCVVFPVLMVLPLVTCMLVVSGRYATVQGRRTILTLMYTQAVLVFVASAFVVAAVLTYLHPVGNGLKTRHAEEEKRRNEEEP